MEYDPLEDVMKIVKFVTIVIGLGIIALVVKCIICLIENN